MPTETAAERAEPLLTLAEGAAVIDIGMASAAGAWCGLDWADRSFAPLMATMRAAGHPDKVIAYVGLLHGIAQGQAEQTFAGMPPCSADQRASVAAFYDARWN